MHITKNIPSNQTEICLNDNNHSEHYKKYVWTHDNIKNELFSFQNVISVTE